MYVGTGHVVIILERYTATIICDHHNKISPSHAPPRGFIPAAICTSSPATRTLLRGMSLALKRAAATADPMAASRHAPKLVLQFMFREDHLSLETRPVRTDPPSYIHLTAVVPCYLVLRQTTAGVGQWGQHRHFLLKPNVLSLHIALGTLRMH